MGTERRTSSLEGATASTLHRVDSTLKYEIRSSRMSRLGDFTGNMAPRFVIVRCRAGAFQGGCPRLRLRKARKKLKAYCGSLTWNRCQVANNSEAGSLMSGSYSFCDFMVRLLPHTPVGYWGCFLAFLWPKSRSVGNARRLRIMTARLLRRYAVKNRYDKSPVSESYFDVIH